MSDFDLASIPADADPDELEAQFGEMPDFASNEDLARITAALQQINVTIGDTVHNAAEVLEGDVVSEDLTEACAVFLDAAQQKAAQFTVVLNVPGELTINRRTGAPPVQVVAINDITYEALRNPACKIRDLCPEGTTITIVTFPATE